VAKITLYGSVRTPFTEKVRRALLTKRLAFELCEPRSAEDYKGWNPKSGMLPILYLEEDGALEMIEDSTAIVYALDARFPDPPLLSPDPTVASQQRQLANWSDESFLWYFLKYRRMIGAGEMQLPLASDIERPTPASAGPGDDEEAGSGALRRFAAWLRAGGTWERPITALLREIGLRLDDLVNFLGARPFFYSDRLSVADLGVYAMLHTLRNGSIPGAERLLAVRPSLVAFMARVEEETASPPLATL
jgi:glutathione S-transferase